MNRLYHTPILWLLTLLVVAACGEISHHSPLHFDRFDRTMEQLWREGDTLATEELPLATHYAKAVLSVKTTEVAELQAHLVQFQQHPYVQQLYKAVTERYPHLDGVEATLTDAFERQRTLLPHYPTPRLYTHISGLNQPILVNDSLLSVSLDLYLGEASPLYAERFNSYQLPYLTEQQIAPQVVMAWLEQLSPLQRTAQTTLLDALTHRGVLLYTALQLLPSYSIAQLLAYTPAQAAWCEAHEIAVWQRMVATQQLKQTDSQLASRYLRIAPFTAPISTDSPPRMGCWLGYQLVKSYLNSSTPLPLTELLQHHYTASEVLQQAHYGYTK